MNQDKVLFIIVTYNGIKWISRCLESVYNSNCRQVFIVDNGSTDGTVAFIKSNFPEIEVCKLDNNIGFGAANNIGIKKALALNFDFVFLLNQDAYLVDNALSTLISCMKGSPDCGIISPLHLNGSGSAFDKNFLFYLVNGTNRQFVDDLYFEKIKSHYPVPFVNAAAWLISRSCFEKVGFFDSLFFHYGEDDNYCQRVLYHGFKILVSPDAVILHDREERDGAMRPEFVQQQSRRALLIDLCNPFKNTEKEIGKFKIKNSLELIKTLVKFDFYQFKQEIDKRKYISSLKKDIIKNTRSNQRTITK